jgi:hypothetical protein
MEILKSLMQVFWKLNSGMEQLNNGNAALTLQRHDL